MEDMRRVAYVTVLRACGFASLAIFCTMVGFSFQPRLAFQTGAFFTLLMSLTLIFKAYEAQHKDYRRTEMWLYLSKEQRPPASFAQWASATVLRDTYFTFAKWTALVSISLSSIALLLSITLGE